jgi:hypothetical protein
MQTSESLRVNAQRHSTASHRINVPVYRAIQRTAADVIRLQRKPVSVRHPTFVFSQGST